jgi:hypothetical protein
MNGKIRGLIGVGAVVLVAYAFSLRQPQVPQVPSSPPPPVQTTEVQKPKTIHDMCMENKIHDAYNSYDLKSRAHNAGFPPAEYAIMMARIQCAEVIDR